MINVDVKIESLDRVREAFQNQPELLVRNLGDAVQRIAYRIEASAKREAPVNKQSGGGNLRQSIASQMFTPISGMVFAGVKYAGFVHEGTRPHVITVRSARVLANRRTGQIFGRRVQHPGTKANPFMKRAVDANQDEIEQELNAAVDASWERV